MVSKKKTPAKKTPAKKMQGKKEEVKKTTSKETFTMKDMQPILKNIILPVVLVLVIMWFAFYIRSGPISLDGLEQNVENNLMQNIQQIVAQQVQQEYPNLNEQYQQELVAKEYNKVLQTRTLSYQNQEINIDDLIQNQAEMLKQEFKADNGQTYLTAIDPYYFLRKSENLATLGTQGDEIINGVGYETMQKAPIQKEATKADFHTWIEAQLLKANDINENSPIGEKTQAIFILPALLAALCVIPIFLFTRLYTNDIIASIAALLVVSIGTFVSRTTAGFVDTDAYNVLFPLAIAASVLYGFTLKSRIATVALATLAGLFSGLFLWAWAPGWFFIIFISLALAGYLGYLAVISYTNKEAEKSRLTNAGLTLLSYFVSSYLFTYIFAGKDLLLSVIEGVISGLSGDVATISQGTIWPNVFSSVAELNPAPMSQIISSVGGQVIFILALLGLLLLSLDFKKSRKDTQLATKFLIPAGLVWFSLFVSVGLFQDLTANSQLLYLILLFIPILIGLLLNLIEKEITPKVFITMLLGAWMAGTIFMSFNGVRFILLLAPAFAISAAFGFYYVALHLNKFLTQEFKIEKKCAKHIPGYIVVLLVFSIIFIPMVQSSKAIGDNGTPNFDDSWYDAMYNIRDNSSEDAIITSWWDFGHFFAAIADRGVTFDGGTQTTPQSHWVGKLLVESNEDVSHDILRMLVCDGNGAFEKIYNITEDPTGGVWTNELIYATLGETNTEEILQDYSRHDFTQEEIDSIMESLACENPRENFLITSGDMVNKGGVWAHWGLWDFTKKYTFDNYQSQSAEQIAQDLDKDITLIEQYVDELETIDVQSQTQSVSREDLVNRWFSPYPSYADTLQCGSQGDLLQCQNGLEINLTTRSIETDNMQGVSVKRIIFPTQELEVVEQDPDGRFDLLVLPSGQGNFQVRVMQAPLGTSLFTKLYFLQGLGTEHFENFYQTQTQTAGEVIVWKTNWSSQ